MNEINVEKQKLNLKILKITWYFFIPALFVIIIGLQDGLRTTDYVSTLLIVLITDSIGKFFLSLYSQFLEELN